MALPDWKVIAPQLWKSFSKDIEYSWPIKDHQRQELAKIITQEEYELIFQYNHEEKVNRVIRPILSQYLTGKDTKRAQDAAVWIVATWGGIKRGKEKIKLWMGDLEKFEEEAVKQFIKLNDTRKISSRISSWSKLLAFYDEKKHAIYDARTSISINCALAINDFSFRFYMPVGQSRNETIKCARNGLRPSSNIEIFGYTEYLDLLRATVDTGCAPDIFSAEMKIFSSTEYISKKYIDAIKL